MMLCDWHMASSSTVEPADWVILLGNTEDDIITAFACHVCKAKLAEHYSGGRVKLRDPRRMSGKKYSADDIIWFPVSKVSKTWHREWGWIVPGVSV